MGTTSSERPRATSSSRPRSRSRRWSPAECLDGRWRAEGVPIGVAARGAEGFKNVIDSSARRVSHHLYPSITLLTSALTRELEVARGARGCRDCSRCNRGAVTKLVKGSVRVSANVATLGAATAFRRKCGVCGHPLTAHTGQVVAVTNQQPAAPIIVQVPPSLLPPPVTAAWASSPHPEVADPDPFALPPGAIETTSHELNDRHADSSIADELRKLAELHQLGVLSDEEFTVQKARLLDS